MAAYDQTLAGHWSATGLAAENVQARIRGSLLMALSNDRGLLVLTTGNKSEMSVGYATSTATWRASSCSRTASGSSTSSCAIATPAPAAS